MSELGLPLGKAGFLLLDDLRRSAVDEAGVAQFPFGFGDFLEGGFDFLGNARPLGFEDGRAFCLGLPERAGVVAVPTVVFYDDEEAGRPLVRFAFCKRDAVIDEAAARLARLTA